MKKSHWTAVTEFVVIKPTNEIEKKGEILKLSMFGEFCPEKSLRGYSLPFLLMHPKNYRITKVVNKGVEITI